MNHGVLIYVQSNIVRVFFLRETNYILLINGSKGLLRGTYFFIIVSISSFCTKIYLKFNIYFCLPSFESTNFVFEY